MNKKALFVIALSTLLFTCVAGTIFIDVSKANPYMGYYFDSPPPADVQPQTNVIISPENNSVYASNNLSLAFNVNLNSTNTWYDIRIDRVYYKASWQNNSISVYNWSYNDLWNPSDNDPYLTDFCYELNFTEIPEGNQSITVTAYTIGSYVKGMRYYEFNTNVSSSVIFSIAPTPEHIPITMLIAPTASVAFVGVGLLVYFKKHKH